MGYDLYTVESNRELAEKYAKKYNYTYLIDADGKYDGDDQIYFRANIWGMACIRSFINKLQDTYNSRVENHDALPMNMLDKLIYNDGEHVTKDDILDLFGLLAATTDTEVDLNIQLANHSVEFEKIQATIGDDIKEFALEYVSQLQNELNVNSNGQPIVITPDPELIQDRATMMAELIAEFINFNAIAYQLDGYHVY